MSEAPAGQCKGGLGGGGGVGGGGVHSTARPKLTPSCPVVG